jgi:diacylglycerol kinase (ATP)
MAPDASLNDGLLDVFVVKKSGITKLIQLMAKLTRGEHTTDNSVLFFKASQFEIVTGRELKMNVDGEYGGVSPASFHVLPNHLEVFVGA